MKVIIRIPSVETMLPQQDTGINRGILKQTVRHFTQYMYINYHRCTVAKIAHIVNIRAFNKNNSINHI